MSEINEDKLGLILNYSETAKSEFTLESQRDLYKIVYDKVSNFKQTPELNVFVIAGLRGTGKTTILKSIANKFSKSVYISGDYMRTNGLSFDNVIEYADKFGIEIILIDEIHNLENWGESLKINSDLYRKKMFIITGSSSLLLRDQGAKIKRRAIFFDIYPLSLREFLKIKYNLVIEQKTIDIIKDLFNNNLDEEKYYYDLLKLDKMIPKEVYSKYGEYLERQFPLTINLENPYNVTRDIVERAVEKDIPLFSNLTTKVLVKVNSIIQYLSLSEKTNVTKISNVVGLNQDTIEKILLALEMADIIRSIDPVNPTNAMKSNQKRYVFTAPSVRLAYSSYDIKTTIGYAREDLFAAIIFANQRELKYIYEQKQYDFVVNGRTFEIGGKSKKAKNVIVIAQNQKLKYDNTSKTLYVPLELFSLIA